MKSQICCFAVLMLMLLLLLPLKVSAQGVNVVINELLPNPVGSDTGNEWIELYNPGDQKVFLDGWSLKDKTSSYSLNGKSIDAKTYIVVFPTISLNNTDEEITLTDGQSYVDLLNYATSTEGKSLERKYYSCSEIVEHPSSHTKGLINFNYDLNACGSAQEATLKIFSKESNSQTWNPEHIYFQGSKVQFKYEFTGSNIVSFLWTYEGTNYSSESIEITPKVGGSLLKLSVTTDTQTVEKEVNIVSESIINLNEVFADPEGSDSENEWIELYNPNNYEVNLSNWILNIGSKSQKIEDIKIGPKSFVVIGTTISLPNTSAEVALVTPNGLVSDSFQYLDTEPGMSWMRIVDGEGDWLITTDTKGKTNYLFTEKSGEVDNEGLSEISNFENKFEPDLVIPTYEGLEVNKENPESDELSSEVKKVEVNKSAFAGFMFGEIGIFGFTFLKREEFLKIVSWLFSLIKG